MTVLIIVPTVITSLRDALYFLSSDLLVTLFRFHSIEVRIVATAEIINYSNKVLLAALSGFTCDNGGGRTL